MVQAKDVRFFYVKIPNQPNVKLKYNAAADHDEEHAVDGDVDGAGDVSARRRSRSGCLIKLTAKRTGQFVQMPVCDGALNIATNAQPVVRPGSDRTGSQPDHG